MPQLRSRNTNRFTVAVPGSKSLANRALLCAALAEGSTMLFNVPDSEDVRLMIDALRSLGHSVEGQSGTYIVKPHDAAVETRLQCGLAGTTSRFLTALAATRTADTVIDGNERLRQRPIGELLNALTQIGIGVTCLGSPEHLPVRISPTAVSNKQHHSVALRGDVSSQFISALMMIGASIGGLSIEITSELVSRPYVDMTASVMRAFGAAVEVSEGSIRVSSVSLRGCRYIVEPDFSSASFPIVAALICGGEVRISNLGLSKMQGDSYILEIARMVGGEVMEENDDILVRRAPGVALQPFSVNLSDCSDLAPIVTVLALFAEGRSEISGIGFIRQKESNRVDGLADQLRRCGASIEVGNDGLKVVGGVALHGAKLNVSNDHRLAMSFAVLATRVDGIAIDVLSAVDKSWPTFWTDMVDVVSIAE